MIDLHSHSVFSDGEFTPNELLKKAEQLKLDYFSITDHNNCFAYEDIENTIFSGKLIKGVELVTSFEKHIIEVLGYGVEIQKINEWSKQNAKKELEYAKSIYDILFMIFEKEGIFYTKQNNVKDKIPSQDPTGWIKQYIYEDLLKYDKNQEIIGKEILSTYSAFNKKGLNNPNSILFIHEYTRFPTLQEVVELIHNSNGLCFLAHLYQYNANNHIEFLNKIVKGVKLDGIETYHSSFSREQIEEINEYADKLNLYKCGGSDYHGKLKPGINLGLDLQISNELIKPWISKIKI